MRRGLCLTVLFAVAASIAPTAAARAGKCEGSGGFVNVVLGCTDEDGGGSTGSGGGGPIPASSSGSNSYMVYWVAPACPGSSPGVATTESDCGFFHTCTKNRERRYFVWGREVTERNDDVEVGPWRFVGARCLPLGSEGQHTEPVLPEVTWQMVLTEIRRLGLPAMTVQVQPAGQTLVNFDTIFYAEPSTFARTLEILGRAVDVEARPSRFLWTYGDGRSQITTTPGAPYPAKTIVHQYRDAHVTVHPRVDVVYTAQFRVDGGAWQDIPETITIPGPSVDLRIREATPVLSGAGG